MLWIINIVLWWFEFLILLFLFEDVYIVYYLNKIGFSCKSGFNLRSGFDVFDVCLFE